MAREEHGGVDAFDVDAVAAALRWVIGRSPRQADEAADRRLLRALAASLPSAPPGDEATPRALDAHLDAALAELAAAGEVADHCAPRHRPWVDDAARIYFGPAEDLPVDLRERIGSEAVLATLHQGVTNRARAAALALGIDANLVRVRREPILLEAAASALAARSIAGPAPVEATALAPPPTAPPPRRTRPLVAAGVALVALVLAGVVAWTTGSDGDDEVEATPTTAPRVATATAVDAPVLVLARDADALVAVTEDGVVDLGLDGVTAADAVRDDGLVHVVAEREDGHLVHATLGPRPAPWVDLGSGRSATIGATTAGTTVVVAATAAEGHLVRRTVARDGHPAGGWERLAATGVVDVDMTTNLDGRLEVGGVTEDGTAFNVWQSEPPDGWSSYSDDRAGEAGERAQLLTNDDGRLELWVERADGEVWNTWQVAQGRGWEDEWDPRHLPDAEQWRVGVGPEGRLVAVALTPDGLVLRQQVAVPQTDGSTRMMWPPSTVVVRLDPLDGVRPTAVTLVDGTDAALVVASGDGRTVAVPVGPDGPGEPRPLVPAELRDLVPVDG